MSKYEAVFIATTVVTCPVKLYWRYISKLSYNDSL